MYFIDRKKLLHINLLKRNMCLDYKRSTLIVLVSPTLPHVKFSDLSLVFAVRSGKRKGFVAGFVISIVTKSRFQSKFLQNINALIIYHIGKTAFSLWCIALGLGSWAQLFLVWTSRSVNVFLSSACSRYNCVSSWHVAYSPYLSVD